MPHDRAVVEDLECKFAEIRRESKRAIEQVDATSIRRSLDGDASSIAVTMQHVGGNLRSRFKTSSPSMAGARSSRRSRR